ncbi:hypothetical protein GCM10027161_08860 [Microbispora hainanensis]
MNACVSETIPKTGVVSTAQVSSARVDPMETAGLVAPVAPVAPGAPGAERRAAGPPVSRCVD